MGRPRDFGDLLLSISGFAGFNCGVIMGHFCGWDLSRDLVFIGWLGLGVWGEEGWYLGAEGLPGASGGGGLTAEGSTGTLRLPEQ